MTHPILVTGAAGRVGGVGGLVTVWIDFVNGVRHRSAPRLHIVSTTRKRAWPLIMRS